MLIGLGLCLLGITIFGAGLDLSVFLAIIFLMPVFLIALRLAWFFSALGVFIRDISQIGSFLGLALLYSRGVFYSASKAKATAPEIWTFLQWNPLLQIIDSLRQVVLWGGELGADEVAANADTIAYELFCKVTRRVPLTYV